MRGPWSSPEAVSAASAEHLLMMDGVSGETVIDIPLDARFAKRFGNPYAVTHRADIHGARRPLGGPRAHRRPSGIS